MTGHYVLIELFRDGSEKPHALAPYSDPDKAFRALLALMRDVPEIYGGREPVRQLQVIERDYQPAHAALPKRRPGEAYALSVAPEAVVPEYAHEVEAT